MAYFTRDDSGALVRHTDCYDTGSQERDRRLAISGEAGTRSGVHWLSGNILDRARPKAVGAVPLTDAEAALYVRSAAAREVKFKGIAEATKNRRAEFGQRMMWASDSILDALAKEWAQYQRDAIEIEARAEAMYQAAVAEVEREFDERDAAEFLAAEKEAAKREKLDAIIAVMDSNPAAVADPVGFFARLAKGARK